MDGSSWPPPAAASSSARSTWMPPCASSEAAVQPCSWRAWLAWEWAPLWRSSAWAWQARRCFQASDRIRASYPPKPDDWGIEPAPCHLYHPMHGTYQMLQLEGWGAAAVPLGVDLGV